MHVRSGVVWAGVVLGLALTAASAVDGELERAVAFSCMVAAGALFYLAYRTGGRWRTATLAATAVLGSVATLVFCEAPAPRLPAGRSATGRPEQGQDLS